MRNRKALAAAVVIIDIRRDPGEHDLSLLEMLDDMGIAPIVVLTKSDKVKPGQRAQRKSAIAGALGLKPADLIIFSAVTGEGKDELWKKIKDHLFGARGH
jgi:GTP-binding protein